MSVSTLIVDDEPHARLQLQDLLGEIKWINCVGEATEGEAAVEAINALQPDLLFLDIQLPGLLGLRVLEKACHRPAVIFTSAHDKYAVAAFELQAIDYLLKPFGRDRLLAALARVPHSVGDSPPPAPTKRVNVAFGEPSRMTRLFVKERGRIVPLSVDDIERFESRNDYVAIHAKGQRFLVHVSMSDLEARLDPSRFLRVHRSHIVNLDFVSVMTSHDTGRLEVEMLDGTRLFASRARSQALRSIVV